MSVHNFFDWKGFWKVKIVPPKVQVFIWRMLQNGLAVCANISRFVMGVDEECMFCGIFPETIDHLFVHCTAVRALLFASQLGITVPQDYQFTVTDLLETLLNAKDGGVSFSSCACLMWCWWRARNKLKFEKIKPCLDRVISKACSMFREYFDAITDHSNSTSHAQNIAVEPEPNVIKINVDAGVGVKNCATAAVARDHCRQFSGGAAKIFKVTDPIIAEALAVLTAVNLAVDINSCRCIIEGDAQAVIMALQDPSKNPDWRITPILADIRKLARKIPSIDFTHVKRTGNEVAHYLAHYALLNHISYTWLLSPPPCIEDALASEMSV